MPSEWPKPSQHFQCPNCREVFASIYDVAGHWADCKPASVRNIKLHCPFDGCLFWGKNTSLRTHLYAKHSRNTRAIVPPGVWPTASRLEVRLIAQVVFLIFFISHSLTLSLSHSLSALSHSLTHSLSLYIYISISLSLSLPSLSLHPSLSPSLSLSLFFSLSPSLFLFSANHATTTVCFQRRYAAVGNRS